MRVRVLGPVDVLVDGETRPVQGLRRKAILAVLALHRGEIVSTDRLIDVVWSNSTAVNTVQSHISQLRHVLGSRTAIVAHPPGYVLDLGGDTTDVETARRLIEEGKRAADPERGASALRSALALWRGRSLADVTGLAWLDEQAEQLEVVRRQAEQALVEARLALGEHARLVPELEKLALDHPFDERLHGQLMLALYRSGRQADALGAYQRLRHKLGEDLGIDPGHAVRELEAAILRQESALEAAAPPMALTSSAGDLARLLADGERALHAEGDLLTGRRHFEAAHQLAEQAGDGGALARAVLGLGGLWVHEDRSAAGAARMRTRLRHALSVTGPDSALGLRLRIRSAGETDYRAGVHGRIVAVLDEARRAGDPIARAEALSLAHHCLLGPDHGPLRRKLAVELIGESSSTGRRSDLLMGLLWQTVDVLLEADPHAERRLAELRDLVAADSHLAVGFAVSAIDVMLTIRAGRFGEAEALAQDCAVRGEAAGDIDAAGWYGAHLFAIRWFQGRLAELLPMLDGIVHSPTLSALDNSYFAALAVAAAQAGDRRKAAGALATLAGRDLADLPRSSNWLLTMSGVVEAAHLIGDAETSARAYELLSPFAHLPVMASLAVACFGSVQHNLGVAALTCGDAESAVTHLRAAVRHNLALAHWPAVVFSRRRYAQALELRARPPDAAQARRELATAEDEAADLARLR